MASNDTATVALIGTHFGTVAIAVAITSLSGRVSLWILLLVQLTAGAACIASLQFWDHMDTRAGNWTLAGYWGFMIMNFSCFVLAVSYLDSYLGCKSDLLGRALAHAAQRVSIEVKKFKEEQTDGDSEMQDTVLDHANEGDHSRDKERSPAPNNSSTSLGGGIQSLYHAEEQLLPGDERSDHHKKGKSKQVIIRVEDKYSFDVIAKGLPRALFENHFQFDYGEETAQLFGMGSDVQEYSHEYARRMIIMACMCYSISILFLVTSATLQQVSGGKIDGWLFLGWIVLGDAIILVRVFGLGKQTGSSTDSDWTFQVPKYCRHIPVYVLFMLLLLRTVLTLVPNYLSFGAQCIYYVLATSYLLILIGNSVGNGGGVPKAPLILFIAFSLWLGVDTVLVALSNQSVMIAEYMGETHDLTFHNSAFTVNEWVAGLAAFILTLSIGFIHYATWFRTRTFRYWFIGYGLLCFVAFSLDTIAAGQASISLGVFVAVALLFPAFFAFGWRLRVPNNKN